MVGLEAKQGFREKVPRWLKVALAAGGVVLIWAISFYIVIAALRLGVRSDDLPGLGDLATLLFGAASLALFIFSLLIAGVAIIGYQTLRHWAREDIEAAMRGRIDMLERELRGRVHSVIGFMIGALHSTPDQLEQKEHKHFLSEAVWYCKKGYDILKDLTGKGQGRYMALNNLVYYSCLYGDELRRDELLTQARELKKVGQQYGHPPTLLTYCRAVLQYGSMEDLQNALSVAKITQQMELTEREKKEATFYVTSISDKLSALQGTTSQGFCPSGSEPLPPIDSPP
jgi:hypothetical protein